MKLAVPQKIFAWILRWTQCALFVSAVSMLAYCGLVLTDAWMSQALERRDFDRQLADPQGQLNRAHRTASLTPRRVGRQQ